MRPIGLASFFCIVLATGGCLTIRLMGFNPQWSAALIAAGAGILAIVLAYLPLIMLRGLSPTAAVQLGLAATVIHMLVMLFAAAMVILWHLPIESSFVFWLMGMYIITLTGLVGAITGPFRSNATGSHA